MEEYKKILAYMFDIYNMERIEKWAKYLIHKVTCYIQILRTLKDITLEIAVKVFKQFCNIQLVWVCWIVLQGIEIEKLVKVSMIFAVKPSNTIKGTQIIIIRDY